MGWLYNIPKGQLDWRSLIFRAAIFMWRRQQCVRKPWIQCTRKPWVSRPIMIDFNDSWDNNNHNKSHNRSLLACLCKVFVCTGGKEASGDNEDVKMRDVLSS